MYPTLWSTTGYKANVLVTFIEIIYIMCTKGSMTSLCRSRHTLSSDIIMHLNGYILHLCPYYVYYNVCVLSEQELVNVSVTGVYFSKILVANQNIGGGEKRVEMNIWAFLDYRGKRARAAPPRSTPIVSVIFM